MQDPNSWFKKGGGGGRLSSTSGRGPDCHSTFTDLHKKKQKTQKPPPHFHGRPMPQGPLPDIGPLPARLRPSQNPVCGCQTKPPYPREAPPALTRGLPGSDVPCESGVAMETPRLAGKARPSARKGEDRGLFSEPGLPHRRRTPWSGKDPGPCQPRRSPSVSSPHTAFPSAGTPKRRRNFRRPS